MTQSETIEKAPQTKGVVIRWARLYDTVVKIISLGREREMRGQTIALADIRAGQRVLDVGCGTGTLAIAVAKSEPGSEVLGIDPAPEMVERARNKAGAAGARVDFKVGVVENLGVEDCTVDVVLSSLMLHHLPGQVLADGLAEIFRVLKPGGRLVAVDFFGNGPLMHRLASRFRGKHSHSKTPDTKLTEQLREIGFVETQRGQMKPRYLSSLVAQKPKA